MRMQGVFALAAVLACGAVPAQQRLGEVKVRADTRESMSVPCADPASVPTEDVERVLAIKDPSQTPALRTKLISAAGEACRAGVPSILVSRGNGGKSLTWKALD